MSILLPKRYLYQILFFVCIGITYLDNFELTFGVWAITFVLTLEKKYSLRILQYISFFIAIMVIGLIVMRNKDYEMYYIIRDITYVLKPVLGLLIGYQICKKTSSKIFKTIIYTGFIISILHLSALVYGIVFRHASTLNDLRYVGGFFSDFEIYALIILIFYKKFEIQLPVRKLILLTLVVGISSFLYFARTNFIQFIILFIAMKGHFTINKRSINVFASILLLVLIGYSSILYINPKRNGPGIETLLYKIKIAPIEAFKTKIDRTNWRDLNDNYRSYENITTVKEITNSGISSIIFGLGIGSQIDLKQKILLGDTYLQYISILHNGFMTVFLKSGLLGVLIYLYSIYLLFKQSKSSIPIIQNINLLLIGTGVFLIFSSWVFMGLYNKLDNKSILIGLLFCFKEMIVKNNSPEKGVLQNL